MELHGSADLICVSTLLVALLYLLSGALPAAASSPGRHDLHTWPDHLRNLDVYEVVVPRRVDQQSSDSSSWSSAYVLGRRKRSSDNDDDDVERSSRVYELSAFGRRMSLRLRLSPTSLVSPSFVVQHLADNETWLQATYDGNSSAPDRWRCFHEGQVDGDPQSIVVLSTCSHLVGVIYVDGEWYFIEPLTKSAPSNVSFSGSDDGDLVEHVIYPRNATTPSPRQQTCHVKDDVLPTPSARRAVHVADADSSSSYDDARRRWRRRRKRSHSRERHVEVLVAVDVEMRRYHGHDLEHYILTLMAIVASIYRDASIGNAINIVVVKIVVLEADQASLMISKNAATTLRSFCRWQHDVNIGDDSDGRHHDTALLLTRHDICRSIEKCDTLGLAELGTMCDPLRSCSIIKDSGLSAAFTVAHELGHVFSLRHDDECNGTKTASYHVMAPTLDYETKPWSWSQCSRDKITEFIDTGFGECLNDEPSHNLAYQYLFSDYPPTIDRRRSAHLYEKGPVYQKLPGSAYTADKQCAHTFEHETRRCPYMPVCSRLWCTNPHNEKAGCKTQHMPWADGTICSNPGAKETMWCYHGRCIPKRILVPRDGGWGRWQDFQECSRSCGGGIMQSIRMCDNPKPENGGKFCMGRRVRYKSCNHMDCPPGSTDFREHQCSQFNGKHFNIHGLNTDVKWVAKYSGINPEDRCKLFCRVSSSSAYYQLGERVIDGTKCGPDTSDVCVMGQCRRAGCDNRLGSNTKYDSCGVCGGDNSQCRQVSEQFTFSGKMTYGYSVVTRIPRGSTNLEIRQYAPNDDKDDDIYLALVDARGNYVLNGNFIVSAFHKELHVSGTILEYSGSGTIVERINGTGVIYEDIYVHVLTVGDLRHAPVIHWQYTVRSNDQLQHTAYTWSKTTKNWSPCSHVCQGVEVRRVVCVSSYTGLITSDRYCVAEGIARPDDPVRSCNADCQLSWQVVSVGECRAQCGEAGLAVRDIRCAKLPFDVSQPTAYVSDEHCSHLANVRPSDTVECVGSCIATHWIYSTWSECTRTCGSGERYRSAECVDVVGRRLDDSKCVQQDKLVTQACNSVPCPYWIEGHWSACSASCGRGWRYRAVQCKYGDNNVLKSYCNSNDEPDSSTICNVGLCPAWKTGVWGLCSTTCGRGVQQRAVSCRLSSGVLVDDSACDPETRPGHQASCHLTTCPHSTTTTTTTTTASTSTTVPTTTTTTALTTVAITTSTTTMATMQRPTDQSATWRTGGWTPCSATCGPGVRQRYVSCRYDEGHEADPVVCRYEDQPASTERCLDRSCGHWRTGEWTPCSSTCGEEGEETRYVACVVQMEDADMIVDDEFCDVAAMPDSERPCWPGDCLEHIPTSPTPAAVTTEAVFTDSTAYWRTGSWGPCSSTCEDGVQMRRVVCQDDLGASSTECDHDHRPLDSQSCNQGPCPHWNYGDWTSCDVTCGGAGTQRRIVQCQLPSGDVLPDTSCHDAAPPQSQPCGLDPCPQTTIPPTTSTLPSSPSTISVRWKKSRWSTCSVTCSRGAKTRRVACIDEEGQTVEDYHCDGKKPREMAVCRRGPCPHWVTSRWSQCSASCGEGTKSRTVSCVMRKRRAVDSQLCQALPQPAAVERCHVKHCSHYHWITTSWSQCSRSCGLGAQYRAVSCVERSSNQSVAEARCSDSKRPHRQRSCSLRTCPTMWITSDWTPCSVTCGIGIQKRAVSCRAVAREGWLLPSHQGSPTCSETDRPESERICSSVDCTWPYRWETSAWSLCSKTCGFGRAHRELYCVDEGGHRHPAHKCHVLEKPETHRHCYVGPCYSTSCKQLRHNSHVRTDGEFNLLIGRKLVQIYCSDMSSPSPKEYITLSTRDSDNYSEVYDKRLLKANTCPVNDTQLDSSCVDCSQTGIHRRSGKTLFSKLRLNITTLEVITTDFTFSTTQGFKPVPFATAGDCYSSTKRCPQGKFRVDLRETDFMVSPGMLWTSVGNHAVHRVDISADRQTVNGTCGGHCGLCVPTNRLLQLQLMS